MANEIRDIDVEMISLVKKGANGQPIKIYKSADPLDQEPQSPEVLIKTTVDITEENKRTLLDKISSVLGLSKQEKADTVEVSKRDLGDFNEAINNLSTNLWRSCSTLSDVLWSIAYSDESNRLALMLESIDQFKEHVTSLCNKVGIEKAAEGSPQKEILKSNIEGIKGLLTDLQNSVTNIEKEDKTNMTKEEFTQNFNEMSAPMVKSIEDLTTMVTDLSKSIKPEPPASVEKSAEEKAQEAIVAAIKSALEPVSKDLGSLRESITSVNEKVEKLENTAGAPNGQSDPVEKSEDVWSGVFWPDKK